MNNTRPSDSAFPALNEATKGVSKREYFAALAIEGLCGNDSWSNEDPIAFAKMAVQIADALIEEMSK